jgi:hypothetical protein
MAKSFKPIGTHAIAVLARLEARNAVKAEIRDQGARPETVKPAEISERARRYLEANPHLYEEAYSRAWRWSVVEHIERIEQTLFDDERRRAALVPAFRRAALFKTLKPTC